MIAASRDLSLLAASLCRGVVVVRTSAGAAGAGIAWDGLVLTNRHVVTRGEPVVILEDGTEMEARIEIVDEARDLALLRAAGPDGFPPIALPRAAPGAVRVGEPVRRDRAPLGQPGRRHDRRRQRARARRLGRRTDHADPHGRRARARQLGRPARESPRRAGGRKHDGRGRAARVSRSPCGKRNGSSAARDPRAR